jgi:hypothetical protein
MSAKKSNTPKARQDPMAAIERAYRDAIDPIDFGDLEELVTRLDSKESVCAHFETLVEAELAAGQPQMMSSHEYTDTMERIRQHQPEELRKLSFACREYEERHAMADQAVAFRVGVAIGRVLGGVR